MATSAEAMVGLIGRRAGCKAYSDTKYSLVGRDGVKLARLAQPLLLID